jgi:Zn finger protein HypA/HybF involved in hydrogenase expression
LSRRLTIEQFIARAQSTHGDKYNYSLADYKDNRTKVKIICLEHGEFLQSPDKHMSGRGCPKCSKRIQADKGTSNSEEFISKAKAVHGEKYLYDNTYYLNAKAKVIIICPIHGEFQQEPSSHLTGKGCPKCGAESRGLQKRLREDYFVEKANEIHKGKYDYSSAKYSIAHSKVTIICPTHGSFEQTPNSHLNGAGCPKCAIERRIGENNCQYKDGLSKERYKTRHDTRYSRWVKAVKQDAAFCDCCGVPFSEGTAVHAHHLDGWHWAIDKRFDLNNGVALCNKCHYAFHSKYSTQNNTNFQYVEFKEGINHG